MEEGEELKGYVGKAMNSIPDDIKLYKYCNYEAAEKIIPSI